MMTPSIANQARFFPVAACAALALNHPHPSPDPPHRVDARKRLSSKRSRPRLPRPHVSGEPTSARVTEILLLAVGAF